jgi:hypothetical protein
LNSENPPAVQKGAQMNDQSKPKPEPIVVKLTPLASLSEIDVRDLKFHAIADEDPLMNDAEFEALKASIKPPLGVIREPITLFRDPVLLILDGRNRYNAGKVTGYRWAAENFRVFNGTVAEARRFAAELNDIRRHLSAEQKKEKQRS